jgi:drug/metabolite transporter (DMT)-like permease
MDSRTSGYFYAIFAAFMLSTAFVTIKKLLEYVNTASLVFQYFSVASVLLFLIILARKDIKFFAKARGEAKTAVIIAALGIITAVMFQLSIQLLTPSFFAFIMRLSILTAFMLGVVFLKERFTRIEAVGTALAIAGTAILTYSPGKFLFLSVIFGVATAVIIGVQDFTWKKMVRKTHPITMNFYRTCSHDCPVPLSHAQRRL